MLGIKNGKVKLSKFNKNWHKRFLKEKNLLSNVLKDFNVKIEHIGSTSIIGARAKPIIDISVGLKNIDDLAKIIPLITSIGYVFRENLNKPNPYFARKYNLFHKATYHLHLESCCGKSWQRHILFRDYCNSFPEVTIKYNHLKQQLYKKYKNNRHEYQQGKEQFIDETIEQAIKYFNETKVTNEVFSHYLFNIPKIS